MALWEYALNLGVEHTTVVPITIFVAVLCLCLVTGHLLEESRWVNESITAIFTVSHLCCFCSVCISFRYLSGWIGIRMVVSSFLSAGMPEWNPYPGMEQGKEFSYPEIQRRIILHISTSSHNLQCWVRNTHSHKP